MIQPVIKPVVHPVWQLAVLCKQTSNWLSNQLSNRLTTVFNEQLFVQPVVKPHCTTGLTTVLNEQPLSVQPCWMNSHRSFNRLSNWVVQPAWQPAVYTIQPVVNPVECLYTRYNRLSNRFDNWFDNRFYCVYKHLTGCQTGLYSTRALSHCSIPIKMK